MQRTWVVEVVRGICFPERIPRLPLSSSLPDKDHSNDEYDEDTQATRGWWWWDGWAVVGRVIPDNGLEYQATRDCPSAVLVGSVVVDDRREDRSEAYTALLPDDA